MRILSQTAVIFAVCLLGVCVSKILPLPSSVAAMVILFLLLVTGAVKREHIRGVSDFLLAHMAFFFIPAGVGLIDSFPLFSGKLVRLILVCTINTVITFAAAAFTVTLVSRFIDGRNKK